MSDAFQWRERRKTKQEREDEEGPMHDIVLVVKLQQVRPICTSFDIWNDVPHCDLLDRVRKEEGVA